MPGTKAWWTSRTLWLNSTAAALVALELHWGLVQPLVPVNAYTTVAVGLPVLNAALRIVTTQPVGWPHVGDRA